MGYKTILVHADLSRHATERVALAAAIGAEHAAHLLGAAMTGMARSVFPRSDIMAPARLVAGVADPLADAARNALLRFEEIARRHGVSYETRLVYDQAPDGLALLARFADLAVVSQDDPDESLGYTSPGTRMPEYVVANAACPVLVVPRAAMAPLSCPRRVLLCWNGSVEASKAMAAAIPLMQRAFRTTLAVFAPAFPGGCASEQELADAQAFLGRHAVRAEVALRDPRHDTGRAIFALAAERNCDLVVMGCFGHTRFQELLLGGASRTVLQEAKLPVLMAR